MLKIKSCELHKHQLIGSTTIKLIVNYIKICITIHLQAPLPFSWSVFDPKDCEVVYVVSKSSSSPGSEKVCFYLVKIETLEGTFL